MIPVQQISGLSIADLPARATQVSQGALGLSGEGCQLLRAKYWEQVKQVKLKDLVFLDEMGILLGLTRSHARLTWIYFRPG